MADQKSERMNPGAGMGTTSGNPGGISGNDTKASVAAAADKLKETGARAADEARRYASDMGGKAKEQGRSMFDRQRDNAAAQVGSVAHALRSTAERLQGEGQSQTGRYVGMAADRLESLGRGLREKDMNALLQDAENIARRSPGVFFAGAVVAGFLFSRFLKSSARSPHEAAGHREAAYSTYDDDNSIGVTSVSRPTAAGLDSDIARPATGTASSAAHAGAAAATGSASKNIGADGTGSLPSASSPVQPGGNTYGNR